MKNPVYFTVTKTEAERTKIINAFSNYSLPATSEVLQSSYPQLTWPYVSADTETKKLDFHQAPPHNGEMALVFNEFLKVSKIKAATPTVTTETLVLPNPAKYKMVYRDHKGRCKTYTISNPIEAKTDSFTAYAYGRGIRTFKKNRILKLNKT